MNKILYVSLILIIIFLLYKLFMIIISNEHPKYKPVPDTDIDDEDGEDNGEDDGEDDDYDEDEDDNEDEDNDDDKDDDKDDKDDIPSGPIKFSAGKAGIADVNYPNSGGGGAGGILASGYTPISNSANIPRYYGAGGSNGEGFGSGGGGGGNWNSLKSQTGGEGNQGFVYIVEDDNLITESGVYETTSDGEYTIIMMGGGGAGGGFTSLNSGGSSGHIIKTKINIHTHKDIDDNKYTDKIKIKIGKGGKQATTVFPAENGYPTIIKTHNNKYIALGGDAGSNPGGGGDELDRINNIKTDSSKGGNPSQNGHKIKKHVIHILNNN